MTMNGIPQSQNEAELAAKAMRDKVNEANSHCRLSTGSEMADTERLDILLKTGRLYVAGVVGYCLQSRSDIDKAIMTDRWILKLSQNDLAHSQEGRERGPDNHKD